MKDLLTFLEKSPSRFHAAENLRLELEAAGYRRLSEGRRWDIAPGGKYYVTRNGSALAAFRVPGADFPGFMLSASHSDSPSLRVKENAELEGPEGYVRLNVEKYGGIMYGPWLDRPLTVAGRALVRVPGGIESRLVYIDRDLLVIPNLAIHLNRSFNDGYRYDPKCDMVPLLGQGLERGAFRRLVAESAGCEAADLLGTELFLCLRQRGILWGLQNEFISAPTLDDLQCVWGCFQGFLAGRESASLPVFALLDNEEVGSLTKQGAAGTFLIDCVERICAALGRDRREAAACSFLVSADNSHAVHPNRPEYADPTHRPVMNGGVVIKHGVRYATDGAAQAVFAALCRRAGVPVQHFSNRSDLAGGSTLGNIANAHLSLHTVDIGLAQLAMHSCFETAGARDTDWLIQAMTAFYGAVFREENGRFTLE